MSSMIESIGTVFCIVGGMILLCVTLALACYIMLWLWQKASNEFRAICKAESLIFEYKKERDTYLKWKKAKEE